MYVCIHQLIDCGVTYLVLIVVRLNQEDHDFKASLGYMTWPCLKEQKQYKLLVNFCVNQTFDYAFELK